MQNASGHVVAGIDLLLVGTGELQDLVVALGEVHQALLEFFLCRAGIEAEIGLGALTAVVVDLRGEEVHFRLAGLTGQSGMLVALVDMMRQRAEVIEELGIGGPSVIFVPEELADHVRAKLGNHLAQQHFFAVVCAHDIGQALVVRGAGAVFRVRRGGEPALVNAAARKAQRVVIIRMQLDPAARTAEGTGNPRRRQTENAFALLQELLCDFFPCHFKFLH